MGLVNPENYDETPFISTTTVPKATKLGRVVTYHEGLQTIKSYNTLIKWLCKVVT